MTPEIEPAAHEADAVVRELRAIRRELAEMRATLGSTGTSGANPSPSAPRINHPVAAEPRRRFHIGDGLILVVAVAFDLGLTRTVLRGLTGPATGNRALPQWVVFLIVAITTWIVATLTWLALRLAQPRPTLRRLATRPGFVAVATAGLLLVLDLATFGLVAAVRPLVRADPIDPFWWFGSLAFAAGIIGPAVGAAWILLALSGRRRPQRNAFDIAGRLLGVGWIVLYVVGVVGRIVFNWRL